MENPCLNTKRRCGLDSPYNAEKHEEKCDRTICSQEFLLFFALCRLTYPCMCVCVCECECVCCVNKTKLKPTFLLSSVFPPACLTPCVSCDAHPGEILIVHLLPRLKDHHWDKEVNDKLFTITHMYTYVGSQVNSSLIRQCIDKIGFQCICAHVPCWRLGSWSWQFSSLVFRVFGWIKLHAGMAEGMGLEVPAGPQLLSNFGREQEARWSWIKRRELTVFFFQGLPSCKRSFWVLPLSVPMGMPA